MGAPAACPGVNTLIADVTDSGQVFNALTTHFGFDGFENGKPASAPDAVVHFAAIPRVLIEPDNKTYDVNVMSTYNVIEAAMKLGVRKVVIASSETTYGVCFAEGDKDFHSFPLEEDYDVDPMDSYGLSKVVNEKTARAFAMRYGADIYALRIGNVIEPHEYDRFPAFVADPPSRKRNAWSYIDARDLGEIVHLCLQKDGLGFQVFNATNDTITANLPTAQFLARYCPGVPVTRAARRVRGAAVEPQDARGARLQGGAQLAPIRLLEVTRSAEPGSPRTPTRGAPTGREGTGHVAGRRRR